MEFVGRTIEEALENAMTKLKPFGGLFRNVYGEKFKVQGFVQDDEYVTVHFEKVEG